MNNSLNMDDIIDTLIEGPLTLAEVIKAYEVSTITERFGQWAVTDYGLECFVTQYPISVWRLDEQDWALHMREKRWINIKEFAAAYKFARKYHGIDSNVLDASDSEPPSDKSSEPKSSEPKPLFDYYTAQKLSTALLCMHETFNSIDRYIPDDLPRPKAAPMSFSVKNDGILSPAWAGFTYAIDGFLAGLYKQHLITDKSFYDKLLGYSRKQFESWLNQVLGDAFRATPE